MASSMPGSSKGAELPTKTTMVGRQAELDVLKGALEEALGGHGRTLFLAGEAGIGKTRMLDELRDLARQRGAKVMSGTCFAENLTPFIAYMEAFREGKLDHLFAEDAVRVETVYLVDKNGLLVSRAERAETPIDPDIFTSMLQAVENFVKDSLAQGGEGALNVLGYGDYRILIEKGGSINLVAIVTGKENEFLVQDLQEVIRGIEEKFGDVLTNWDGSMRSVEGTQAHLQALLTSDKYEGLDPAKADPQVRRNRLFDNVALGLVREAKLAPILLCLDDLQWADPSTLALTHYVSRNAKDCGLLLLGTYRSEDLGTAAGQKHPLVETLQLMSREGLYETVEIKRLQPEQIQAFVGGLLGQVEWPEDYEPGLFRESGGNPFYLTELVRMMTAEAVIVQQQGVWRFARPLSEVEIPNRIQQVVVRRLQRLDTDQRDLLDVAAVIGENFGTDILAKVSAKERIPLLKALRPLESDYQLIRAGEEGYRFDHAKIREVLYTEMPEQLRREYHGLVGTGLEQLHPSDADAVVAELAHHFYQARNRVKGVQYSIRGGDNARQMYANDEAIRLFSQALELMGVDAKWRDQRLNILEVAGDLRDLAGQFDGALRFYADLLEAGPDAESRARMHRKRGSIYQRRGDYPKAEEELNAATSSLTDRIPEAGRVLLWRGRLEHRRGNYVGAADLLIEAAGVFDETGGDPLDQAEAHDSMGLVHWVRQEVPDARHYWEASIQARKELDDQKGLRAAYNNVANTYAAVHDWENALKYYDLSLKTAIKIGDNAGATKPLINIGHAHALLGHPADAAEAFQRALKTALKVGDQRTVASVHRNLGSLYDDTGDLAKAEESYTRCLQIAQRIGEQLMVAGANAGLASVAAKRGRREDARTGFTRALELFKKIQVPDDITYADVSLGWLDLEDGDVVNAERRLSEAESTGAAKSQGHVGGALAGLRGAIVNRHGGDAEAQLREALRLLPKGAMFEVIRVSRELGELLKARGDPEATSVLTNARTLAAASGDTASVALLDQLLS